MGSEQELDGNNDILSFAKEDPKEEKKKADDTAGKYKLLIVDDEKDVHVMTKMVLADYAYNGCGLKFLSAYSGKEARHLIKEHPDAAIILLDVVMETKNAGLDVSKFIRQELKNHKLRIILRTGQPGKAPERDVILNYDINDYKEKTELTTQKLFTTVTTALRSYLHLVSLEGKNREIAEKNVRLNEEIARRIVAESNLSKYNRSLEKMIETKSSRLKSALQALRQKENELKAATQMALIGDLSSNSVDRLDLSKDLLENNLKKINTYRLDMTRLLEKYETLQNIIGSHAQISSKDFSSSSEALEEIIQVKHDIDFDLILKNYPQIIDDSSRGIENISRTVSDIQRFIDINNEPKRKTDINRIMKQAIQKTSSQFKTQVEVQTSFNDIPTLITGPENLGKAFLEILKNAFEAVGQKGIICVNTQKDDTGIHVEISDTGQGIEEDRLLSIFRPYYSGRPGSAGLGLSFAKSVITANNGAIKITSHPGEGTAVSIYLTE